MKYRIQKKIVVCIVCHGKAHRETTYTKKKGVMVACDEYCETCGYHYVGEDGEIMERIGVATLYRNFQPDDRDAKVLTWHRNRSMLIRESQALWNTKQLRFLKTRMAPNANPVTLDHRLIGWLENHSDEFPISLEICRQMADRLEKSPSRS